jgi:acyl dehydratase
MAIDRSIVGKTTGRAKVIIERGPVAVFATAVKDEDPVRRDPRAASEAGYAGIPVPPTFPGVMEHWGRFTEIQSDDPPQVNAFAEVIGPRLATGGILLHGEQEFEYHRPVYVGDVLSGESVVADAYEKESKGHVMTFLVVETSWSDDRTGEPVVTSRMNLIHRA